MKNTILLLLLLPMTLCVNGQTTVTLNLPNPCTSQGINDPKTGGNFHFSVFPNPSNNQFILSIETNEQIGAATVEICNAQGMLIYKEKIFSKNQTVIKTINTENLSGGLYLISVQGEKYKQTKTIIFNKN